MTPVIHIVYSCMGEKGKVVRVLDGTVEVALEPGDACATCPVCGYCHPAGNRRVIIGADPGNVEVGDEVAVTIISRNSLVAIFSFFGIPVLLSLIGLLIGQSFGEIRSLLFGTGGFVLGLVVAKVIDSVVGRKRGFIPKITRIGEKTHP